MSFNGNEGSFITLNDASDLTADYRATIAPGDTIAQFVGKQKLLDILNQPECVGVRIYYGLNKQGEKKIVLVGADSNEDDLYKGLIVDDLLPCPNSCSANNPLNF